MNTRPPLIATVALAASLISGAAQAALYDRGGGLIYDDVLNVTWLQDANFAKTSGYDADGLMTWAAATTWAVNLSYFDSVRNVTYVDWRLPNAAPINGSTFNLSRSDEGLTDYGFNISAPGTQFAGSTASELAHLYYNSLGNKGYCPRAPNCSPPQLGYGLVNTSPFNIPSEPSYWFGTALTIPQFFPWMAPDTTKAMNFQLHNGAQAYNTKEAVFYAWAVRDGDVAAVPEVQTYALMLAGLGLVGAMARRREIAKI